MLLHERALKVAKNYLGAESDLIEILQEVDDCRGYRDLRYRSLSAYATGALGLSPPVAFSLMAIARKAVEVPRLQKMLREQRTHSFKRPTGRIRADG